MVRNGTEYSGSPEYSGRIPNKGQIPLLGIRNGPECSGIFRMSGIFRTIPDAFGTSRFRPITARFRWTIKGGLFFPKRYHDFQLNSTIVPKLHFHRALSLPTQTSCPSRI